MSTVHAIEVVEGEAVVVLADTVGFVMYTDGFTAGEHPSAVAPIARAVWVARLRALADQIEKAAGS